MSQQHHNQLCFKQPVPVRVIVVNPVTTAYSILLLSNFRRLDPAGQGLVTMTLERLAAG
jgi:hypothetical protein